MTTTLSDLLNEVKACKVCAEKLPLGPRPVFQIGVEAKVLIAGQAPGRKVHQTGIPFDDPSGDTLRTWLGIDRATFYEHPGGNLKSKRVLSAGVIHSLI